MVRTSPTASPFSLVPTFNIQFWCRIVMQPARPNSQRPAADMEVHFYVFLRDRNIIFLTGFFTFLFVSVCLFGIRWCQYESGSRLCLTKKVNFYICFGPRSVRYWIWFQLEGHRYLCWYRSRKAEIIHIKENRKEIGKFWSAGCSFLMARSFSCILKCFMKA